MPFPANCEALGLRINLSFVRVADDPDRITQSSHPEDCKIACHGVRSVGYRLICGTITTLPTDVARAKSDV
jgi:hypothetical protein